MAIQIRRRELITLGGAAMAWPLAARAQGASGRVARIAYLGALSPTTLDPRQIEQFNVGLVENGANRSLVSRLAGYYCLENKAALNREAEG